MVCNMTLNWQEEIISNHFDDLKKVSSPLIKI